MSNEATYAIPHPGDNGLYFHVYRVEDEADGKIILRLACRPEQTRRPHPASTPQRLSLIEASRALLEKSRDGICKFCYETSYRVVKNGEAEAM